jgi:acyl dehydratase
MLILQAPADFGDHVGTSLGPTDWREVTQIEITAFADLTGDDHWIHVDHERAARDNRGGRTIAHGLFILSLVPKLQRRLFRVERRGAGLFYGYDKVRFIAPVPVGSRIRLRQTVTAADPHRLGTRVGLASEIEMEETGKTVIAAQGLLLISDG